MEKLKARKLRRLKIQKDGWEKAFQLISEKFRPSQKVEDIQRLLKDCGNETANFTDRPIDTATIEELDGISKKFSIECKAKNETTRQYYVLAKENFEKFSKEYNEFEVNYKKNQRKRLIVDSAIASVILILLCAFIYYGGPKYLRAENYMRKGNYEAALEWYSQCGDFWNTSDKESEAKYQIAEKYMREENYREALEWYSECEDYLDTKEREREARYQIAEGYMQDGNDVEAMKWYTKCNNYKDAKDKAEKTKSKIEKLLLQSLGFTIDSRESVFALGNVIPCGLVKASISYDEFLNANGNYIDKTNDTLTYGNYVLYGFDCEIKYYFDAYKFLREIRVYSPYIEGEVEFAGTDIEKIGQEIKSKLNVEPKISGYHGTRYTFEKDGIIYKLATYASPNNEESNIQIRLIIKAK